VFVQVSLKIQHTNFIVFLLYVRAVALTEYLNLRLEMTKIVFYLTMATPSYPING